MKIKFNPNLDFQLDAIRSIVDIFEGNTVSQSNFTVSYSYGQRGIEDTELGIGNRLDKNFDEQNILENVQNIQLQNNVPQSSKIEKNKYNFTVEMETGTGKTYVYLRTIFELNRKYGFKKFIIVVPSKAIKEGVIESIRIMTEHFKLLYDNVPFKAFLYHSQNIEDIREFATSDQLRLMIMTVQSFERVSEVEERNNVINRPHERTNGLAPIEFIQNVKPIVIVDEPQTTMSTPNRKKAISKLNPLFTVGYSATLKEKYHLMYQLNSVDAYRKQLVKQIEIASVVSRNNNNFAYFKLEQVRSTKTNLSAKIKIRIRKDKGQIKEKQQTVRVGDDIFEVSNQREVYQGFIVDEISNRKDNEFVKFTNGRVIELGKVYGDVSQDIIKRAQIKKTIQEHLEKELRLKKENLNVLSLFFLDKVENYRVYTDDGYENGKYAEWFEEELEAFSKTERYEDLLKDVDFSKIHNGYFSEDRSGHFRNTRGDTQADESTYEMIMKNKEKLLSPGTKLKFIFSHSALKEGWDNPNVFQICTLNENARSEMRKRQEIGRGLRLAVDHFGERRYGFDINTLTVMTNEAYDDVVYTFQKELEEDEGIRFGFVEKHSFASITTKNAEGEIVCLEQEKSAKLFDFLKEKAYITEEGKVTDPLRTAIKEEKVELPVEYDEFKEGIISVLDKIAGKPNIKNSEDRRVVKINKDVFDNDEFKALWDRVKYKTTYSINYDSEELITNCLKEIDEKLEVQGAGIVYTVAAVDINHGGVTAEERERVGETIDFDGYELPDVVTYLQNQTSLTRKTIVRILTGTPKLELFNKNPQQFMDKVGEIIKRNLNALIVDGIKYEKIGDDEFYDQQLFENEELFGYLNKNMRESTKSVYDHVVYDSNNEEIFAKKFENNKSIKVYAKLPDWFKIDTPIGTYNPDWAVLFEKDGSEKLYLVVETKGNINNLRTSEEQKIKCGKRHFDAVQTDVVFKEVDDYNAFVEGL